MALPHSNSHPRLAQPLKLLGLYQLYGGGQKTLCDGLYIRRLGLGERRASSEDRGIELLLPSFD
jgi:hypothetical protein